MVESNQPKPDNGLTSDQDPLGEFEAGYAAAREFSNGMGYNGESYEKYLREADQERIAKGIPIRPWPNSTAGNDGD